MIEVYFYTDQVTAAKIATYLKTWHIQVFYNTTRRMYYINVVSAQDMNHIATALQAYNLFV